MKSTMLLMQRKVRAFRNNDQQKYEVVEIKM